MTVRLLPEARNDLRDAVAYYERQRQGLGVDFTDAFERAILRLVQFPQSGSPVSPEMRRSRLNRFPYGIIYYVEPEGIVVAAIMHLHRKPDAWQARIKDRGE